MYQENDQTILTPPERTIDENQLLWEFHDKNTLAFLEEELNNLKSHLDDKTQKSD